MDLATFTNAPKDVVLAGHAYQVSALQLREWGIVQAWIKANVPSPIGAIRSEDLEGLNPSDRRVVLESAAIAQRNWPPKPGTLAWFQALDNPGGHEEFLFTALLKHQPSITRETVAEMSASLSITDVMPVILACLGVEATELKRQGAGQASEPAPAIPIPSPRLKPTTHLAPRPSRLRKRSAGRPNKSRD